MPINRHCGLFFLKSKPPLIEKCRFVRRRIAHFEYFKPVFLRLFKERVAVDIIHEHNAEHGGEIGKAPTALDTPLHDHEQQVDY